MPGAIDGYIDPSPDFRGEKLIDSSKDRSEFAADTDPREETTEEEERENIAA